MIARICYKLKRLAFYYSHPFLWGKSIQINGIPKIGSPKKMVIGKYVSLNESYIQCAGGVILESYVTVSHGVTILTAGLDTKDYSNRCFCENREHVFASVVIGEGSWLCANVTVTPGVKIAPRIIVAAGSVVSKDLDKKGWLYAGIPARPIKPL